MFWSQVVLKCGKKLQCWAQFSVCQVSPGGRCCIQCWQQGCSAAPPQDTAAPISHRWGLFGRAHLRKSTALAAVSGTQRLSLQPHVGPHAGECGDFLKGLWPWRAHAGVCLAWRTAASGEDHAGAGERCEKEGTAERSSPDTTIPFPSELLKMGEAEVVCVWKCEVEPGKEQEREGKVF